MLNVLKRMSVGRRIIALCTSLILLSIIISVFSLLEVSKLEEHIGILAEEDIPLMRVLTVITERQLDQSSRYGEVLQYSHARNKEKFDKAVEEFRDAGRAFNEMVVEARKIVGHGMKVASTDETKKEFQQINTLLVSLEKGHAEYQKHSEQMFQRLAAEGFAKQEYGRGEHSAAKVKPRGKVRGEKKTAPDVPVVAKGAEEAESIEKAIETMEKETREFEATLDQLLGIVEEMTKEILDSAAEVQKTAYEVLIPLSIVAVVGGFGIAYLIASSIIVPLRKSTLSISSGAEQVSAASSQLASASEMIASTTTEQAAAVEETLSNVETIHHIAKGNRTHAHECKKVVDRLHGMISKTEVNLTKTADATSDSVARGKKLAGLLGHLNDALVQIDLLAVNTSVEATRSEATRGFAIYSEKMVVVAQQAKDAVRQTLEILSLSGDDMARMAGLTETTRADFGEVGEIMARLVSLTEEIASTVESQAESVSQVNYALRSIDEAIQSNAASSEETAAAGEELNAQALSMLEIVRELVLMVEGARSKKGK